MIKARQIEILLEVKTELQKTHYHGICNAMNSLYGTGKITYREYLETNRYLEDNKPTYTNKYNEFMYDEDWLGSVYWWKTMRLFPRTRKLRIDYISKLISNTK